MRANILVSLLCVFFIIPHLLYSQTYTVEVEVVEMWFESRENFYVEFQANIYKDGQLIPHSSDYF